ncbi:MAG: patatin-like phospholipase family protein, partial [Acidobacteria bacterium]|nr:patatin-like phospholipase family protein [Acidobacteriota bacterium]
MGETMKLQADKKIGLALGGGGARGLADLGVLKVLQEHRIPISYIAGVSVGALIGALYASGMPLKQLMELASQTRWRHLGRLGFPLMGLSSNERMEGYLARYISQDSFEALQIPLRVIATN